jgi:hypothetical protein
MVDIYFGEFQKKLIRVGAELIRKKMGASTQVIDYDIEGSSNEVVKALDKIIIGTATRIKSKYQQRMVKDYGRLALWILTKDTAYRDAFFWMLYNLLLNAEKLLVLIKPYVKDPKEWYSNVWVDGKEKSKELKEQGRIPDFGMSLTEKVYVPRKEK